MNRRGGVEKNDINAQAPRTHTKGRPTKLITMHPSEPGDYKASRKLGSNERM